MTHRDEVHDEDADVYYQEELEDEYDDENAVRQCGECCSHWDNINQCCWIVSERGLCTSVSEGDYCIYNFKENDGR